MENRKSAAEEPGHDARSRRSALALLLGASGWLEAASDAGTSGAPVRLAISESLVADVNMNDARAAILVWIKQMTQDWNISIEFNPKVFDTSLEILNRVRGGKLDAVALNVVEYRQIADYLETRELVGEAGLEQYLILVQQNSAIRQLGDLRGHRLILLNAPRMCVASAWLTTLLDKGRHAPSEQFFRSVTADAKVSRVVLPVFFGQVEACLTSKRGFDLMCELNPQVSKSLRVLAASPEMVVTFYAFRRNYSDALRQRVAKALSGLRANPAGRQLATLFQFEDLAVRDAGCLAPALAVLDAAERARGRSGAGSRKG